MLKQNSYIISLEAKDIIKEQGNKKGFITKSKEHWIYRGALDFSLEALKIEEFDNRAFFVKGKKQYTKAVVNVNFKYSLEEPKMNTSELRAETYKKGFVLDGKRYVRFKRSGGSSRVGKCLFIREDLQDKMLRWSYMGLEYNETQNMDLASMEAYISLTTSSIIDTININPKSILLINDYDSSFQDIVMATEWNKKTKMLVTSPKKCTVTNSIWDGQSILDSSIFEENGYADKGFLLGRNRFFKSACFNGNIQKFFSDNGITEISQLNGITLASDVKDIKMITTASSIKYLKMAKEHDMFKVDGEYDKIKAFKYWCNNVESDFGIVKYEKAPHNMHQMVSCHYQLLNTLPLSKDDMRELLQQTLDYIKLLKNDLTVFKYHIGLNYENCIEKDCEVNYSNIDFTDSNKLIYDLLMINDKFSKTKVFKKFKDNLLESYKDNLRKGHVLVNGNYSVLFGNGYEMLLHSIGKFDGKSLMNKGEVHNSAFEYNKELLGSRSPHVTMGNILLCKNVECEILDKYFNSSKYIVHVNSIGNNLLQILSGADK